MQTLHANSFATSGAALNRAKMFRTAKAHTRWVKLLRVGLPVTSLLLLALYMIPTKLSLEVTVGDKGRASASDVVVQGNSLRMENPQYQDGRMAVKADHSLQDVKTPHILRLNKITARVDNQDKGWVQMLAVTGLLDTKKNFMRLEKKIDIKTDSGVNALLSIAYVDMKKQTVTSWKPVTVTMPNGNVYAEKMTYFSKTDLLNFEKNVKVHLENKPSAQGSVRKAGGIGAMMKGSNDPIKVTSNVLSINHKKQTAVFRGGVLAMQAGLAMQSDALLIDYKAEGAKASGGSSLPGGEQQVKQIIAENNVVITTNEGQQARADRSVFDNQKQLVTLLDNVVIEQGDNMLQGQRMIIDLVQQHSYFPPGSGRVKGLFKPRNDAGNKKKAPASPPAPTNNKTDPFGQSLSSFTSQSGEPFTISADSLSIYDKKKYAIFKGKVEVLRGEHKIRSAEMRIDYHGNASVSAPKTKGKDNAGAQLKSIIASGRVFITTPENQALSGDKAIFNVKANTVTVDGNVAISQGDNLLKGDKVVVDLNTGQYKLHAKRRTRMIFNPKNDFKLPGQ